MRRSSAMRAALHMFVAAVTTLQAATIGPPQAAAAVTEDRAAGPVTPTEPPLNELPPGDATAAEEGRLELIDRRTVDSRTFINADGTYTTESFASPINFQDDSGAWQPIATAPVASERSGIAFESKGGPVRSEFGAEATTDLLTVRSGEHSVTFRPTLPPALAGAARASARAPEVDNGQVVYRDVYPNVDLRYTLLPFGAKEDIVLTEPSRLHRFAFGLDAPGLTPRLNDDGSIDLLDTAEAAAFHLPAPFMVDSTEQRDGDGVRSTDVDYELLTVGNGTVLVVSADKDWLADPARVYPVYIDPTTTSSYGTTSDTFISSAYPSYNLNAQWNPAEGGYYELWNGRYDATSGTNYAFVKTGVPSNVSVVSATFNIYVQHSYMGGSATGIYVGRLTSAFSESQTWNMTHPSYVALTSTTVADNQWASFNVTSAAQAWANGSAPNHGFRVYESSTAQSLWKRLRARENATNAPYLSVTYTNPIATTVSPIGSAWVNNGSLDWNFSANGSSFSQTKFHAQISDSSTSWSGASLKADSGEVASSATAWTAPVGNLALGGTYYWRVRVYDGQSWSAWTSGAAFRYDQYPSALEFATVGGAVTSADPTYYDVGNGTFTVTLRARDSYSGVKHSYMRLFNAVDEMRVYHDWSIGGTHCDEFNGSTLVDSTACVETYNAGNWREVTFTVVGLNADTSFDVQYYFTDFAGNNIGYNSTGKSLIFDAIAPTGAITAPSAGATVIGTVAITGTASDGNFTEYSLAYGSGPTPQTWTNIATSSSPVTSGTLGTWETSSLSGGTYTLRLRVHDKARVGAGFSEVLRTVTVQPPDDPPPNPAFIAPAADAAQSASTFQVVWDDGVGPSGLGSRSLQRQVAAAANWACGSFADDGSPTTQASPRNETGFLDDRCYRWVLQVTNGEGDSTTITSPEVLVDVDAPSLLVTNPEPGQFVSTQTTAQVSWSAAASSGIATQSVQRQRAPASGGECGTFANDGPPTVAPSPRLDTDLASGSCYRWQVAVTNGAGTGNSADSGVILVDTQQPSASFSVPAAPVSGEVGSDADGLIDVTWSESVGPSGLASRVLQHQSAPLVGIADCGTFVDDGPPSASASPVGVTLAPDLCHRWTLALTAGSGAAVTVTSAAIGVNAGPPEVTFDLPAADEEHEAGQPATVAWSEADDGALLARSLQRQSAVASDLAACASASFAADGDPLTDASPHQTSDLTVGNCYRWIAQVTDAFGESATATSPVLFITPDASGPVVTFGFDAESVSASQFEVSWTVTDASGVGPHDLQQERGTVVHAGTCSGVQWSIAGTPSASASPVTVPIDHATCYRWTLTVADILGNQRVARSEPILVDTHAPTATFESPIAGATAPLGTRELVVAWDAEDLASGLEGTQLQRERTVPNGTECSSGWQPDGGPLDDTSPVEVSGLQPGVCYRWSLVVSDGAGNDASVTSGAVLVDDVTLVRPAAPATVLFATELLGAEVAIGGVESVEFLVDGDVVGSDSSEPYTFDWDTTAIPDGAHTLAARAMLSAGGSLDGSLVAIEVDNSLLSDERVAADAANGYITLDEQALFGTYAFGAPALLPDRYVSSGNADDGAGYAQFVADWDALAGETRDEISAFFAQPHRGEHYSPPAGQQIGRLDPDFPECTPPLQAAVLCHHRTEHFDITYHLAADAGDVGAVAEVDDLGEADWYCDNEAPCAAGRDGVPDDINKIAASLEAAWKSFEEELGYENRLGFPRPARAPVEVHDVKGYPAQVLPHPLGGPGGFVLETIEFDSRADELIYLARHELFHFFQYAYVGWGRLVELTELSESKVRWWLEATAEWAAHQAENSAHLLPWDRLQAERQLYPALLPVYFKSISKALDRFGIEGFSDDNREYGAFIVAEYLEQMTDDRAVIRETWERLLADQQAHADHALDHVLQQRGSSLAAALQAFASAAYRMGDPESFASQDRVRWLQFAQSDPELNADDLGDARPARHPTPQDPLEPVEVREGDVTVEPGGIAYVEFDPRLPGIGRLQLTVTHGATDDIRATLFTFAEEPFGVGPTLVDEEQVQFIDGSAELDAVIGTSDRHHAVLAIVHTEPLDQLVGPFSERIEWRAEYSAGRPGELTDEFDRADDPDDWGISDAGIRWGGNDDGDGFNHLTDDHGVLSGPGNGYGDRTRAWLWPLLNPTWFTPDQLPTARLEWDMYLASDFYGGTDGWRSLDVGSAWGWFSLISRRSQFSGPELAIYGWGGHAQLLDYTIDTDRWYSVVWEADLSPAGDVVGHHVKIWPAGEQEPESWLLEAVDTAQREIEADDWLIFFDMRQDDAPTNPMEIWIDNVNIEGVHSGKVNPGGGE